MSHFCITLYVPPIMSTFSTTFVLYLLRDIESGTGELDSCWIHIYLEYDWCRNSGLEMKSLWICMRQDLVMLVMSATSLKGPITGEMVGNFSFSLKRFQDLFCNFFLNNYTIYSKHSQLRLFSSGLYIPCNIHMFLLICYWLLNNK